MRWSFNPATETFQSWAVPSGVESYATPVLRQVIADTSVQLESVGLVNTEQPHSVSGPAQIRNFFNSGASSAEQRDADERTLR